MTENEMVTGAVLLHFAAVWEPRLPKKETDPKKAKFGGCFIYDKSDTATHNAVKEIVNRQIAAVKTLNGGRLPNEFRNPIQDGDVKREGDPIFAGKYFFNANSKRQPGMFYSDGKGTPIVIPSEMYSGCMVRAHINFYTYSELGNGIGVQLNNLMLVEKGEALAGTASTASQAFGFNPGSSALPPAEDDEDYLN